MTGYDDWWFAIEEPPQNKEREMKMNKNRMYLHCAKCLKELPKGVSPMEWARINVSSSGNDLLLWCVRHDCKIANFKIDVPIPNKCACCGGEDNE